MLWKEEQYILKKISSILLVAILLISFSLSVVAEEERDDGYEILEYLSNELQAIDNFRGVIVTRVFLDEMIEAEAEDDLESEFAFGDFELEDDGVNEIDDDLDEIDEVDDEYDSEEERKSVELRTGIMRSGDRSTTSNLSYVDSEEYQAEKQVLNLIPWIYLPPDYSLMRRALPMNLRFEYSSPLEKIDEIVDAELIGEASYDDNDVYILQLNNPFYTQRWYIDMDTINLKEIEIFNASNIRLFNISYNNYEEFEGQIKLPTSIEVRDRSDNKLLTVEYQNLEVNQGVTEEDFAQGFMDDYTIQIEGLEYELEDDPDNDELYWQLSQLHYENGNLDDAIASLEEAIELNDKSKYFAKMAEFYRDKRDHEAALEKIEEALGRDYGNAEYHNLQGEIKLSLRELRQARHAFERALDRDSDNENYMERLYSVYSTLGQEDDYFIDRARRIASDLVDLEPDNREYRVYLGEAYLKLEEFEQAGREFRKAIDIDPEYALAHRRLAEYHVAINNYDQAEELYNYLLYIDNTINNHKRLADFYFEQGNYDLAYQEYQDLRQRVTDTTEIDLQVAEIYLSQEENEKALDVYYDLLEKDSSLLFEIGDKVKSYSLDLAIDVYHWGLKENELDEEEKEKLYSNLGRVYFNREVEKNEKQLEELFRLDSRVEIYRQLAKTNFRLGNLNQAISYLKLLDEGDRRTEDEYQLALAYLVVDEFALAIKQGDSLIESGHDEPGEKILDLANSLEEFKKDYDQEYTPGRVKRVEGDKLRQQGQLNNALVNYRAAIAENYEYKMPYLYAAIINRTLGNNLAYEMAIYGLEGEERELAVDFATEIMETIRF